MPTDEQLSAIYELNNKASHEDGLRAVADAARAEALESVRKKLLAASKGEPETWGFVAMFMQMIDEVEKRPTNG